MQLGEERDQVDNQDSHRYRDKERITETDRQRDKKGWIEAETEEKAGGIYGVFLFRSIF